MFILHKRYPSSQAIYRWLNARLQYLQCVSTCTYPETRAPVFAMTPVVVFSNLLCETLELVLKVNAYTLRRRQKESDGVSNPRRLDSLVNHLFSHRSKKISKLRVTGLCERNPPVTGGFHSQRASKAETFDDVIMNVITCGIRRCIMTLWHSWYTPTSLRQMTWR